MQRVLPGAGSGRGTNAQPLASTRHVAGACRLPVQSLRHHRAGNVIASAARPGSPSRTALSPSGQSTRSEGAAPGVLKAEQNAMEAAHSSAQRVPATESPTGFAALQAAVPARYQVLLATAFSFVICNMDKVNMSVAIIPMAMDFGWSPSVSGTVQASFFYGYMLCQLPGGYLASVLGGRKVLPAGVALWSGMTCAVPLLATTIPGLCVARAGVGLGEAVAPSAAVDMIARAVPPEERARAVSFVFGGLHVGSIVGLLAAPVLIHAFGWQSVFLVFGGAGLLWVVWFESIIAHLRNTQPQFIASLQSGSASPAVDPGENSSATEGHGGHAGAIDASLTIPYRAFLRSGPVRALMFTHFCHNWFHYTMLAWLPTYFVSTLSVDLMHAAQTALYPPLAGIVASATAGPLADGLIARGIPTPTVRKMVQGASFLGPCAFLLAASSDAIATDTFTTVLCITAALGMSSFSLAGMYCTHQDMSPRYASALLGLTNTTGAIPGIIGVATVGFLYDATGSWQDALFLPSAACMVAGAYAYCLHASNELIDFDAMDNSPFWFERFLPRSPSWLKLPWQQQQQQQAQGNAAQPQQDAQRGSSQPPQVMQAQQRAIQNPGAKSPAHSQRRLPVSQQQQHRPPPGTPGTMHSHRKHD